MSLMSDTQGTPERVWALVRLVAANGGRLPREDVRHWLDPLHSDAGEATAITQTVGAASSLELVNHDTTSKSLNLSINELPSDLAAFGDWVHKRLVRLSDSHSDAVVLRAFAWFVANSAKQKGMTWMNGRSTGDIADSIRSTLGTDSEGATFNATRYPRWRDWIAFLGLGYAVPFRGSAIFLPYVVDRMRRIQHDLFKDTAAEVDARAFLTRLSNLMPYLDGGALFDDMAQRIGWAPTVGQLSPVTSTALRQLHDRRILELRTYGDTRDDCTLSPDPTHAIQSFRTVAHEPNNNPHD